MDVKTIDEKLRERGRIKLRKELEAAFGGIPHQARSMKVDLYKKNGTAESPRYDQIYLSTLRDDYIEALFKNLVADWEQKEVDEFMKQVDDIQDQLNEIQEGVY